MKLKSSHLLAPEQKNTELSIMYITMVSESAHGKPVCLFIHQILGVNSVLGTILGVGGLVEKKAKFSSHEMTFYDLR
jgi:hypothetical protein